MWAEDGWGREGEAERKGWGSMVGAEYRRSFSFGTTLKSRIVRGTHEKKRERDRKRKMGGPKRHLKD